MEFNVAVIIPCYNEANNLLELYDRLKKVAAEIPEINLKIFFIDNKSKDESLPFYQYLAKIDPNVHILLMSRNFGSPQPSLLAGIRYAVQQNTDAAILMDADLQDPPELIKEFIEKWQIGAQVVFGVREKREETLVRRIGYYVFYRIFRFFSFLDIPMDAGDFCLLDKIVLRHMASFEETDVLIRGIRSWVGFTQIGVPYSRPIRQKGTSFFSFLDYVRVAKDAIVNFSDRPLEYVSYLAMASAFFTGVASIVYFYVALTTTAPKGFFTLLMLILFFGTLQLLSLGVIAEYIIRIFREVKKRPPFIVQAVLRRHDDNKSEK
jgi:dolichol-phosphate mannosyltransferase